MKIIPLSLFALAGIAALTFGIFPIGDDAPVTNSDRTVTSLTSDASVTENATINATSQEPPDAPSFTVSSPDQPVSAQSDGAASNRDVPESARVESQVEAFLSSADLHALHGQLLESFSSKSLSDSDGSISIRSLGLERAQQHQLYLEPEDHIILINDTPVMDLANNPAVGSMLAGPTMKLSVQRGNRVVEIELHTY